MLADYLTKDINGPKMKIFTYQIFVMQTFWSEGECRRKRTIYSI